MKSIQICRTLFTLTLLFSLSAGEAALQRVPNTTLALPPAPPVYGYQLVPLTNNAGSALNFPNIVGITSPPGETNRLFVIEKTGYISVITNLASPNRTVFLDLTGKGLYATSQPYGEGGVLGLAFHPGYAT